ncbi:hypothetical protein FJZ26_02885 [Candidatus Parvarchaeota archaeon]|nr:hypothetical protein [Candidatus Parvarchaeota archaeon]
MGIDNLRGVEMKRILLLVGMLALLVLGCTGNDGTGQNANKIGDGGSQVTLPPSPPPSAPQTVPGSDASDMGVVKEFTLEASNWKFEPETIVVNQGDRVKITLMNKDVSHGIGIREFDFSLKAEAGRSATGEFVASKKGTYDFFCNVFCGDGHREMKGRLVVN